MNDSIYSKSKPLHQINIWNDDTNNEVNGSCLVISITNTINIEHYDLGSNFFVHDIMHKKKLYINISIYLFFTRGVRTCKNFTFKLIIQRLLQLYNIDISYGLT